MADDEILPRVAVLEEIARTTKVGLERVDRQFERVERQFERIDHRFELVEQKFDRVDRRLDTIERNQRSDFRWLLGVMLGGFAGMLGVMAHGFHWF
jgi:hypothetical protein